MRQSLGACLLALLIAPTAPAMADVVSHRYEGIVSSASGPDERMFRPGDRISVEYTLDTSVADQNPSPQAGVFHGGLLALQVMLPSNNVHTISKAGVVQTFDDVVGDYHASDQAFFYSDSYRRLGVLGRRPLLGADVGFFEFTYDPETLPSMLESDAMPTAPLLADSGNLWVKTAAGTTVVLFVAEPMPPTGFAPLAAQVQSIIDRAVSAGQLTTPAARLLSAPLRAAETAYAAGDHSRACRELTAFQTAVRNIGRLGGTLTPATETALNDLVMQMQATAGCA